MYKNVYKKKFFPVIVVGSGIAGLICALEAAKKNRVLIVTKSTLTTSNTWFAQGGIAAVIKAPDSLEDHINDTLLAGQNHNNKKAVRYIVEHAQEAIKNLENYGVHFTKNTEGNFEVHLEGGHSFPRILNSKDSTGRTIEGTLAQRIRENPHITVWEETFVVDLLVKDKICYGIKLLNSAKILGSKVILATGGLGYLYSQTTNPAIATGDGIAMAHRGGVRLHDLEFIQFHPTALKTNDDQLFLLTEALRGEGAQLVNDRGERFMKKYHSESELAPRDIVAQGMFREQQQGWNLFLDLKEIPFSILRKKFPGIVKKLKTLRFDTSGKNYIEKIPISPAAHYSCGGVLTNLLGETNVTHLYAIGEVACTGLHGANRLASNSLLEAAVMGKVVGNINLTSFDLNTFDMSKFKQDEINEEQTLKQIDTAFKRQTENMENQVFNNINHKKINEMRKLLRETMWQYGGILRTEEGLLTGIKKIKELSSLLPAGLFPKNKTLKKNTIELKNMIEVSLLILNAALKRKKSLGCHWREN